MQESSISSAQQAFDELREATRSNNADTGYRRLNRIYQWCINEQTQAQGVRFGGAFAKTDYLLKRHKASQSMRRHINEARTRMRWQSKLFHDEMEKNFAYDLKAVATFIALIYECEVPKDIEASFPTEREEKHYTELAEYVRVIVNSVDNTYIYANADTAEGDELKIHYAGATPHSVYKDWDWTYLHEIISKGTSLNIIRPRLYDGIAYPEIIILEPDYLVDISAIAGCFENYSHSHLIYLINKLRPSDTTSAILLGNLASQILDETLRIQPKDKPYADSVKDFFRTNALQLATADISPDFHQQAKQQKENIRNTLIHTLPTLLQHEGLDRMDSTEIMVEPSFFSEMLGLQGRMDFLQMDERILIEQKSGKGGYPQLDDDTPREQQKHYVQLLLYMLLLRYNNREQYERNGRNVYCFLYYSKYKNGLIQLGFAPQLVYEAIKVRNEIVAAEYSYTHGALNLLTTLTADSLNTLNARGTLWERYQRPQIESVLSPIRQATPLERAYYLRMLTFVETEHLMTKIGNQTKENSGFADKWHSTLEEKLLSGNIYARLSIISPTEEERGTIESVILGFDDKPDNDISNFRPGDTVILYPYNDGEEPDARHTMVFRSTIEEITDSTITLHLRSSQVGGTVFYRHGKKLWAIEHDFFESSFTSLYRGIHSFLSAPQQRKDLLLCQRKPTVNKKKKLKGDYGQFNDMALHIRQSEDLFLIIGPPGTGKTSFGMLYTVKEELLHPGTSILLMAYTNRAVDEICGKLAEEGLDFLRIGNRMACEKRFRQNLLETRAQQCTNTKELQEMLISSRIVVGTTTSLNSSQAIFRLRSFTLAVIDEASQILEPHIIGLLSATSADGNSAIKRIVMIGDHKQLPAVVGQCEADSKVCDPLLNAIHLTDCRLSLFERLLRHYGADPNHVYMLTKQGRMHHDIALFPSNAFYMGKLREVPLPHQEAELPHFTDEQNAIDQLLSTRRTILIHIDKPEDSPSDKVNRNEAQAIVSTVVRIYIKEGKDFSPYSTVGIIVPYRNQIAEIRKGLLQTNIKALADISIDTVERYQGSQRDYILYGFTVQRPYQLSFLTANTFIDHGQIVDRKLNVAMTRARKHLLMFGNTDLIKTSPVFRLLIDYMRTTGNLISTTLDNYLNGCFQLPKIKEKG